MTCNICNIHKGEFKSESDYIIAEKQIRYLAAQGVLQFIKADMGSPFQINEYQCNQCKQNWQFLVPDQAFRGGWKIKKFD